MEIVFERTFDDMWELNYFVYERSGLRRKQILGWIAFYFVLLAPPTAFGYYRSRQISVVLVSLALFAAIVAVWIPLHRVLCRGSMKRNIRKLIGTGVTRHRLTTEDGGLRDVGTEGDSLTPWQNIREIVRGKRHLFLFVAPSVAHVVPLRAFPSAPEADAFADEVERRRRSLAGG